MDDLDAAIALVYAQPPSGFVAARSALVRELKAAKGKDDAATVAGLRRPTKLAWAIGEAVRTAPEGAEAFFAAVDALADPGGDLRQRTADLRQAVAGLVDGADGVDPGEATAALLAVAADPEATATLRLGRLADIPGGGGFGGLALGLGGPAAAEEAPPKPARKAERKAKTADQGDDDGAAAARQEKDEKEKEEARRRAARVAALEAERDEAAAAEAAAAARVDAARAAVEAAHAELDTATTDLEASRTALAAVTDQLRDEGP